jgi:hypothetical protein
MADGHRARKRQGEAMPLIQVATLPRLMIIARFMAFHRRHSRTGARSSEPSHQPPELRLLSPSLSPPLSPPVSPPLGPVARCEPHRDRSPLWHRPAGVMSLEARAGSTGVRRGADHRCRRTVCWRPPKGSVRHNDTASCGRVGWRCWCRGCCGRIHSPATCS